MKKLLLLSLLLLTFVFALNAGTARNVYQKVLCENPVDVLTLVTNTGVTTSAEYNISVWMTERPAEVLTTVVGAPGYTPAGALRIAKLGSAPNQYVAILVQIGTFTTQWVSGNHLRYSVTHIATGENAQFEMVIPAGTTTVNETVNTQIIPPAPAGPTTFDINVTSVPTGQLIYLGGVSTTFSTPHVFTENAGFSGLYSVMNPAYTWVPANYQVTDLQANTPINFVGTFIPIVVTPNPAINPMPADMATITRAWDAPATDVVTLMWEPAADGAAPVGYKLIWNGGAAMDLGLVTEYTTPAIGAGDYSWKVIPYANDIVGPGKGVALKTTVKTATRTIVSGAKGENNGGATWAFSIAYDAEPVVVVTPLDETDPIMVAILDGTPLPISTVTNPIVGTYICNFVGIGDIVIPVLPLQRAFALIGGVWVEGDYAINIGFATWMNVNFDAKGLVPVVVVEPTLPVTLSSFTAVPAAQSFVALTWVSESESNMLGYRVYRNETSDFSTATLITPSMIGATNTSTQVTYKLEDREVALNTTYYYWLESVDMTSSEIHGYVTATVTGNVAPELPTVTVMSNVYPNPFRMGNNANIDVALKAGETGTVTVYNILGQSVKTFPVTQGTQKLTWNGRDSKGNACGSGIYFYKLSTPSMNQTKKMVIVK
ncbi:MAG: hypothetical protein CVU48_10635 [Candidatus Cloacimonetes bacterium HGW-Cloacimonetes-1]|jgi:hypothetical protein|nr:MAG: hypothetical protein CVU48_10635 [Candidatus Cloacimonetes bacterium HGW-Cloacimonetes-1]